ncbi:uncharacterized protein LOC119083709 [Bradysia coprophila]|uniref:uncharacterized protein LOC119083709 n=1 Tax=Bradysia coprophila TaxID=38358 RepID=UPI00187DAD1A|nr:uncharacterized protein LOC119083709 [Bradysia coprophila]
MDSEKTDSISSDGAKEDLENLIKLTNSLIAKLTELIKRVEKHIRDCLIAKTTGVSVAAVGTSIVVGGWIAGLVLAVPTFGLSLTVPAVMTVAGTGTAIAGGLTAAGTEIANGIISVQFLDELTEIQRSHAAAAENTQKTLWRIQHYADEINSHSTGNIISGSVRLTGAASTAAVVGTSTIIDDVSIAALRGLGIGTSSAIIQGALRGVAAGAGVVFTVIDIVRLVRDYTDPNPLLKELERIKRLYIEDIAACKKLMLNFE